MILNLFDIVVALWFKTLMSKPKRTRAPGGGRKKSLTGDFRIALRLDAEDVIRLQKYRMKYHCTLSEACRNIIRAFEL